MIVQKFRNLSIKYKLAFAFSLLITTFGFLYIINGIITTNKLLELEERVILNHYEQNINAMIKSRLDTVELALLNVSRLSIVSEAMATGNREKLKSMYLPYYAELKNKGVAQFQFHYPDSRSFLRVHKPESFGDSLASFRETVNAANREKKTIRGLEEGRAGIGFRVVSPLSYQNHHIGSVEFGLDFDKVFIDELKKAMDAEFYLYRYSEKINVNLNQSQEKTLMLSGTTKVDDYPININQFRKTLLNGTSVNFKINGGDKHVLLVPIKDYSGLVIGLIKTVIPMEEINQTTKKSLMGFLIIAVFSIVVSIFISIAIVRILLNPIIESIQFASEISSGNLQQTLIPKNNDEIGRLVKSLNRMKENLVLIIQNVKNSAEITYTEASNLLVNSNEIDQATKHVTISIDKIADVSKTLNDLSGKSSDVANLLDEFSEKLSKDTNTGQEEVQQISKNINLADEAAQTAGDLIERIGDLMRKSVDSVSLLHEKIHNISNITAVINEISNRINLLSLNASIEAARAGDTGRGFAVVAENVSKLADESRIAVANVHDAIKSILNSTSEAIGELNQGKEELEAGSRDFMQNISSLIDIGKSNSHITDIINSIADSAKKQKTQSGSLKNETYQVKIYADNSISHVEEVVKNMDEIISTIENLNLLANKLSMNSTEMMKNINHFKLPTITES